MVFQIDHVSLTRLTSADCYRCHSLYCLARVFQNLPAPHKNYGVSDAFADFQSFFPTWKLRVALSNVHHVQAFRRTMRNLEPILKSCLAAITKVARFMFQKGSKKMLDRIRQQILSARNKATENNKNVCAKQNNFMTSFKYIKTSSKNQVCSVEIMSLSEHILPAEENDWNKQPFSIR